MLLQNIVKSYLLSKKNKINLGDFKNNFNNNEIIGLTNFITSEIKKKTKNIKKKQILVAIYLPRNIYYLSSIFATWLSGNYFVPLNQNWPKKYLESILKDCDPFLIISNKNLNIKKYKSKIIKIKNFKKNTNKPKLLIQKSKNVKNKISYLIYTSGSSGDKKGVIISEKNRSPTSSFLGGCVGWNINSENSSACLPRGVGGRNTIPPFPLPSHCRKNSRRV